MKTVAMLASVFASASTICAQQPDSYSIQDDDGKMVRVNRGKEEKHCTTQPFGSKNQGKRSSQRTVQFLAASLFLSVLLTACGQKHEATQPVAGSAPSAIAHTAGPVVPVVTPGRNAGGPGATRAAAARRT